MENSEKIILGGEMCNPNLCARDRVEDQHPTEEQEETGWYLPSFTPSSRHTDSIDMLKNMKNKHGEVNRLILHRRMKSIVDNEGHFPIQLMFPKEHVFAKFSALSLSSTWQHSPYAVSTAPTELGGHDDKPKTSHKDSACVRFMPMLNS